MNWRDKMRKITVLFAFIFFLAGCNSSYSSGNLKPPEPTITVANQELSYTIGTYSWSENGEGVVADAVSPPELIETVNEVPSGETLTLSFDDDPSVIEVGVWENDVVDLQEIDSNQITLPTETGEFTYIIHASWPEGESDYVLSIRTN